MTLLNITNLNVDIRERRNRVPVLRDINLALASGEVLGLVGESGAGKSMLAKTVLGLAPDSAHTRSGQIVFKGQNLLTLSRGALRQITGLKIALIPQDPMASLNPVRRIGEQLCDGIQLHLGVSRSAAAERSLALLEEVNIHDPDRVFNAYAHELSGGMRQRVLIAMAFSCEPELIIADEPTTALDVTVQKRVLALIRKLQQHKNTSLLFVTHDLGVVAQICDQVAVMFDGRILEHVAVTTLFNQHSHPYTQALLDATPRYDQPDNPIKPVSADLLKRLRQETHLFDQNNGPAVR